MKTIIPKSDAAKELVEQFTPHLRNKIEEITTGIDRETYAGTQRDDIKSAYVLNDKDAKDSNKAIVTGTLGQDYKLGAVILKDGTVQYGRFYRSSDPDRDGAFSVFRPVASGLGNVIASDIEKSLNRQQSVEQTNSPDAPAAAPEPEPHTATDETILADAAILAEQNKDSVSFHSNFNGQGYSFGDGKGFQKGTDGKFEYGTWTDENGASKFTNNPAVKDDVLAKASALKTQNANKKPQPANPLSPEDQALLKEGDLKVAKATSARVLGLKSKEDHTAAFTSLTTDKYKENFATLKANAGNDLLLNTFCNLAEQHLGDKDKFAAITKEFSEFSKNVDENDPIKTLSDFLGNFLSGLVSKGLASKEQIDQQRINVHVDYAKQHAEYQQALGIYEPSQNQSQTTDQLSQERKDELLKDLEKFGLDKAKQEKYSAIKKGLVIAGQVAAVTALAVTAGPIVGALAAGAVYWWYSKQGKNEKELNAQKELDELMKQNEELKGPYQMPQGVRDSLKKSSEQRQAQENRQADGPAPQPDAAGQQPQSAQADAANAVHAEGMQELDEVQNQLLPAAQAGLQAAAGIDVGTTKLPEPPVLENEAAPNPDTVLPQEPVLAEQEPAPVTPKPADPVIDGVATAVEEVAAPVIGDTPAPAQINNIPAAPPVISEVTTAPAEVVEVDMMPAPPVPVVSTAKPVPAIPAKTAETSPASKPKDIQKAEEVNVDVEKATSSVALAKAALFGDNKQSALKKLEERRAQQASNPEQQQH